MVTVSALVSSSGCERMPHFKRRRLDSSDEVGHLVQQARLLHRFQRPYTPEAIEQEGESNGDRYDEDLGHRKAARDGVSQPRWRLHPRVTSGRNMYPALRIVRMSEGFFGSCSSL